MQTEIEPASEPKTERPEPCPEQAELIGIDRIGQEKAWELNPHNNPKLARMLASIFLWQDHDLDDLSKMVSIDPENVVRVPDPDNPEVEIIRIMQIDPREGYMYDEIRDMVGNHRIRKVDCETDMMLVDFLVEIDDLDNL